MKLERAGPYLWRIPADAARGMRVPALVVADEQIVAQLRTDASLEQLANGATLPGIVRAALPMPDIHQGYGLPVGGVVATDVEGGVVSPGAIGFDINCGVRLLATGLEAPDLAGRLEGLVDALYARIPTGVGARGGLKLTVEELRRVLERGARWAVERGYGEPKDPERIESGGRIDGACTEAVSPQAMERGRRQLGTLGSGNHFLEVQVLDEVYDEAEAARLGVHHTGSRGLGHQVCTDALRPAEQALRRYGIHVPDRQLACVPVDSEKAREYLGAMPAAANFAFANRQVLTHWTRQVFLQALGLGPRGLGMRVVSDVAHNIAKEEAHEVEGGRRLDQELRAQGVVARATGRDALAEEMPEAYKDVKDVVEVVHRFGISRRVARLKPVGVIKG